MADRYDKLISVLGFDTHRLDHLFGVVEQELPPPDPPDAWRPLEVSLNRLMDGRRLLVFRVAHGDGGDYRGFLPCSRANAEALGDFLRRAETYLAPAGAPGGPQPGFFKRCLQALTPAQRVEVMAPLTHRHLEMTMDLRLLATPGGGHSLLLIMRGSGGQYRHRSPWLPALAADWQRLLAVAQAALTDWPSEAEAGQPDSQRAQHRARGHRDVMIV